MNKVLTAVITLMAGFPSFAEQVSIQSMRRDLRAQIQQSPSIAKNCGDVKMNVAQNQLQLRQLGFQISSLNAENNPRIQDALSDLTKAYEILGNAESDCKNGFNHTSVLLEMYLERIDGALMEYRFGIGNDLKRARY